MIDGLGLRMKSLCSKLIEKLKRIPALLFVLLIFVSMYLPIIEALFFQPYEARLLMLYNLTRHNLTHNNLNNLTYGNLTRHNLTHAGITCSYVMTHIGFSTHFLIFYITIPLVVLILIDIGLERGGKPFPDTTQMNYAIYSLVSLSISAGISMAYLFASLLVLGVLLYFPNVPASIFYCELILWVITLITSIILVSNLIFFSRNEANVVHGNLTIVSIGVLAVSMGLTFPEALAALPHSIAAQYSNMAGALVGSGLTLIAIGLQWYYEKQSHRNSLT